jgi:hypothetical protein
MSSIARLAAGEMPCDGVWTRDRATLFKRWMEENIEQES